MAMQSPMDVQKIVRKHGRKRSVILFLRYATAPLAAISILTFLDVLGLVPDALEIVHLIVTKWGALNAYLLGGLFSGFPFNLLYEFPLEFGPSAAVFCSLWLFFVLPNGAFDLVNNPEKYKRRGNYDYTRRLYIFFYVMSLLVIIPASSSAKDDDPFITFVCVISVVLGFIFARRASRKYFRFLLSCLAFIVSLEILYFFPIGAASFKQFLEGLPG